MKVRLIMLAVDESGMSTVEYAIGTIAAAAFGAILYTVTGDSIVSALTNIISRALNTNVEGGGSGMGDDAGCCHCRGCLAVATLVVVLVLCLAGSLRWPCRAVCRRGQGGCEVAARGDSVPPPRGGAFGRPAGAG